MGWSSLLEDITERLSSELNQGSVRDDGNRKPRTSDRVDQLHGLRSACERVLQDIKKHLSAASSENMDLADSIIKLGQEKNELSLAAQELSQRLKESQKHLRAANQEILVTKRSNSELKSQYQILQKRLKTLEQVNPIIGYEAAPKEPETRKTTNTPAGQNHSDRKKPPQGRIKPNKLKDNSQSPQIQVRLLRPIANDSKESPIKEAQQLPSPMVNDAESNIEETKIITIGKKKGKIRVYDLAKELGLDNKRVIEDARSEGVNVSVPSNLLPPGLASLIREKYRTRRARKDAEKK